MTIRIFNTLSKQKENFVPVHPGKVMMYVCGPTVYDSSHIGHARSVIVFDVIARYFRTCGFEVKYVRNFTDVDDKIIQRANELGLDPQAVAEKYIQEFYRDMGALNVEKATIEPKATEHIEDIIRFVEKLIEKDIAYVIDGDVYYAIEKFAQYGKLSGRRLEDMEAGARVDVDIRKQNPFDFALWKSAKPGEPYWESPWGKGRPGWHIECSAMSHAFLGETFDIHGGGRDLIFPHHENEIAQSEGVFEKPFARFWIHNGFVNINQEKMSKSLGNFLMIKDILKYCHPEAVRIFLLTTHYRNPVDFTDQAIAEASSSLDRIYTTLKRAEDALGSDFFSKSIPMDNQGSDFRKAFSEAMDDDFNTAKAIGIVFDAVHSINRQLDQMSEKRNQPSELKTVISDLMKMGKVLGILQESPGAYLDGKKNQALEQKSIDHQLIENLISERTQSRKTKNWSRADEIRKQLSEKNIILEDGPNGTTWRVG